MEEASNIEAEPCKITRLEVGYFTHLLFLSGPLLCCAIQLFLAFMNCCFVCNLRYLIVTKVKVNTKFEVL